MCTATTTGATGAATPTSPNTTGDNLCSVLQVAVYKGATDAGTVVYNGSLSAFTATQTLDPIAVAVAANQPYTFKVTLPGTATTAIQASRSVSRCLRPGPARRPRRRRVGRAGPPQRADPTQVHHQTCVSGNMEIVGAADEQMHAAGTKRSVRIA